MLVAVNQWECYSLEQNNYIKERKKIKTFVEFSFLRLGLVLKPWLTWYLLQSLGCLLTLGNSPAQPPKGYDYG